MIAKHGDKETRLNIERKISNKSDALCAFIRKQLIKTMHEVTVMRKPEMIKHIHAFKNSETVLHPLKSVYRFQKLR